MFGEPLGSQLADILSYIFVSWQGKKLVSWGSQQAEAWESYLPGAWQRRKGNLPLLGRNADGGTQETSQRHLVTR